MYSTALSLSAPGHVDLYYR